MQLITALVGSLAALAASAAAQALPGTGGPNAPRFEYGRASGVFPGVRPAGANGPTNPARPQLNTPVNQTSDSRLASVNAIDDWCTFGPPGTGEPIGNIEAIAVAWCTKPRNNARVIPDGTLTAVHFVRSPLYVQVMALGDFTKIGVPPLDDGGELDPHGPRGLGNPVGGNVTSNVTGQDVFYEEWMNFVSYNQVCIRICTAATDRVSAARECEHELDVMGCKFVMPGNYDDNQFESCDGDAAYPPGFYPQSDGSTSTFKQYFVGSYVQGGQTITYTNGAADQTTPTAAFSIPATSNCRAVSSVANGIASLATTTTTTTSTTSASTPTSSGLSTSRSTSTNPSSTSRPSGQTGAAAPQLVPVSALGCAWKMSAVMGGAVLLGAAVLA